MLRPVKYLCYTICLLLISFQSSSQQRKPVDLIEQSFLNPPASAKPWVFWYWMHGAVSKEGITADLEAMKEVGIGGAYLMPIKDTSSAIPFQPAVRQLTPEWWEMVRLSMQEAKRLGLQLAMHVSDGFALAGGPWITPELSMQKLVWTKTFTTGANGKIQLEQPEANENYYKDVAVFAYPANSANAFSEKVLIPTVTTSTGIKAQFLSFPDADNKQSFKSDTACWIQYKYPEAFTCRSIRIHVGGNNYQAQRLIIQVSDNGLNFKTITRLIPPRHGWQDTEEDYTNAITPTTARYFRFVYDKEGTEPGAEDLDAAKWKPSLKVMGIYLSDEPIINQYEAKNGSIWRIATNTTTEQVSNKEAVPLKSIINLTSKMDKEGNLNWKVPDGNWVIVRIGHTSTGKTNATGGAAKGLESDKFNAAAVKLQFDNWFAKAFEKTDKTLAKEVLKVFHVDSWECGSQNWGNNFAIEFKKRRGYDLLPYLLVMTGTPVTDVATSEKVLHHVRQTIAELVNDVFYVTLKNLAHAKGVQFSAESIAPTFVSDGLLHYKHADIPMGEFWLNSPTHDKPNDMLDAISGAHIYGKNIVAAEAFTTLRSDWSEHPGSLKALGDRAFAAGINKLILHVFMHSPWIDKKPGMTLNGIGLFYQRDQTWFKQSKVWIEYLTRCQALLQLGKPVIDIGVFTGEDIPSRSVLPDRLVNTLPGLFGKEKVEAEKKRLLNEGQPQRTIPDGVTHSANMADPENYIDALNGYQYDCFNPDVLMQMKVVNGRVVTPGGASYAVLVIPGKHPMNPNAVISDKVKNKLKQLANAGAKIIIDTVYNLGGKNFIKAPYYENDIEKICGKRDLEIYKSSHKIAWTHRQVNGADVYFLSNQSATTIDAIVKFRVQGKIIETASFSDSEIYRYLDFDIKHPANTHLVQLNPYESKFFIFRDPVVEESISIPMHPDDETIPLNTNWKLKVDGSDTISLNNLISWHQMKDSSLRYYSGTGTYTNTFELSQSQVKSILTLRFENVYNIATIKVNGIDCGTLWTKPFIIDIKKAVKPGINKIEIAVTNTWRNRLIGDELMPEKRTTWFNSPYKLKDKPLLPAGIVGEVKIIVR